MLGGQHLGGRQQGALTAGVDDRQHGTQRYDRLARTHLALQQALHRSGLGEVGEDLLPHLQLTGCQRKRKPLLESAQQRVGTTAARLGLPGGRIGAPVGHGELGRHGLIEDQSLRSGLGLGAVDGLVDRGEGLCQLQHAGAFPQPGRPGILAAAECCQCQSGTLCDLPGRQLGRGGIHPHQAALRQGGQAFLLLGVGDDASGFVHHHEDRMAHLQLVAKDPHLADEKPRIAGAELAFPPVQQVRLAEEGRTEASAAVGEGHLQASGPGLAARGAV